MIKRTCVSLTFVLVAAFVLSACGGGGGGGSATPPPPWQGTLITNPTSTPIVSFTQSVVSHDTSTFNNEFFPGSANVWIIDQDFALIDGFDLQFDHALALAVGTTSFPIDQVYSELTFYTPVMGAAEGVKVAAVSDGKTVMPSLPPTTPALATVITGTYAAFLNATSNSRLQQTLDLTSVPTGSIIQITWQDAVWLDQGQIPNGNTGYSVVIRKLDGTLLRTVYGPVPQTSGAGAPMSHPGLTLTHYTEPVVLSFEAHSSTSGGNQTGDSAYAIIDNVSVKPVGGTEIVTNGSFETNNLTGWTTNTPAEVQNVTSGSRNLEGLNVTRSFYTVPNKLWGRWVDVFSNPSTTTAVTRTVTYETLLGSAGNGVIYDPQSLSTSATTTTKALTSWDDVGNRDVGLVFGSANSVTFISYDGITTQDGLIDVTYTITVPAGGKVAIVNFVLMDGTDTGLTAVSYDPAADSKNQATEIDTAAKNILNNFRSDTQYRTGMTQEQFDAVINF